MSSNSLSDNSHDDLKGDIVEHGILAQRQRFDSVLTDSEVARRKSAIMAAINSGEVNRQPASASLNRSALSFKSSYSALAVLAVVTVVAFSGWWGSKKQSTAGGAAADSYVYATEYGEQANVRLPDGSQVLLNVGSTLKVPTNFGNGSREVMLEGEALFTVTSLTSVPFSVKSGSTVTRVLGTSFLVRRYSTDSTVTVAVRDGRVAVDGNTVLGRDERATVFNNGSTQVDSVNKGQFAFASNMLLLDDVPLSSAIQDMNRWFDVDIKLGTYSLGSKRIIATFTERSVSELAANLELALDLKVVRNGNKLVLFTK